MNQLIRTHGRPRSNSDPGSSLDCQPWRAPQTPPRPSAETWRAFEVGASPGELPKSLPGHQRRPGGPSRWVPALESFPNPSQPISADLEGLRGGCQPWRASQTPPRPSAETWRAFEVGASPGELPKHLPGHQGRPGWPSKWVLVLETFPDPSQAIRETLQALDVGASPGDLPKPLPGHQGRPGWPSRWVSVPETFPYPSQAIRGDL